MNVSCDRLYECNEMENIIPSFAFYNEAISKKVDIIQEYQKLKSEGSNSLVFNFCSYPFLLNESAKYSLLQYENSIMKNFQVQVH